VIGPVGGGLTAPETFRQQIREPWYVKLRRLDQFRQKYDPMLRKSYQRADLVLGVAPYVQEKLPASFRGRFETFSEWGFDEVHSREPRDAPSEPVRFLAVTRLVPSKGVVELIEAFSLISPATSATLEIVGAGPQEGEVRKLVEEKNLAGRVTFHGRVAREEVNKFYASSDVFILPSYREASGGVFLEAMSWGLPVICLDYGGPGTNVPADAGRKIPVGDRGEIIKGLAAAMLELAESRELREECGDIGRRHVAENFFWPAKADRLAAIYESLLATRNPSPEQVVCQPNLT
jgi:glycosyltransferase involved in cell wall biosynthesis